jgi:uncharacterized protein YjbI with pentapeptide repeats
MVTINKKFKFISGDRAMSVYPDPFSGKDRQPLARADVEERLRQAGSGQNLRLAGEDLSGSDLSYLGLAGADLSRTDLRGADLSSADLSGTNLSGADLSRTILNNANLGNANLRGASLSEAFLKGTNLREADLSGASLIGAELSSAVLVRANLIGTNLIGADLNGAELSSANLSSANLIGADLSSANLSGAVLHRANLSSANLYGAILDRADLNGAILSVANLSGANLDRAALSVVPGRPIGLKELEKEASPALRLRIKEEPLTIRHLLATLEAFTSLYVKMWLLQQGRFDDFVRYTEHKDRRFEEEANLLVAELEYYSPTYVKFDVDLSPQAVVEVVQMLIDTITQAKLWKQLKDADAKKERLSNLDYILAIIEKLYPGLDEEKKHTVLQSLMKDILQLAGDQTLEITLLLPPSRLSELP